MRIGVFDSGIGGKAVADKLQEAFSDADIIRVDDSTHLPYGLRAAEDIQRLTDTAIQPLIESSCDVIVIACNTATAASIDFLRHKYQDQKFIGLEPMVKPAPTMSQRGVIAICATPATLSSERYKKAKSLFASHVKVIEPDCSDWASLIERSEINKKHIDAVVEYCLENRADIIVLGCTHYHWIKDEIIQALNGKAAVLEPTEAIVRRVKELLHL